MSPRPGQLAGRLASPGPVQPTHPCLDPAGRAPPPPPAPGPWQLPHRQPGLRAVWMPLLVCDWLPAPTPPPRAEKETKAKVEKIIEIRDLTTQIMNIKR